MPAVVRGLEALDQPSRVTLVTPSRYVHRGLRDGLPRAGESGWLWESFGQMTPIKHEDLWRRVDHALSYHRVQCRTVRVDAAETSVPVPIVNRRRKSSRQLRAVEQRAVGLAPTVILSKREKMAISDRTPWLGLRQRVASVLMGLGQAIAPEVAESHRMMEQASVAA